MMKYKINEEKEKYKYETEDFVFRIIEEELNNISISDITEFLNMLKENSNLKSDIEPKTEKGNKLLINLIKEDNNILHYISEETIAELWCYDFSIEEIYEDFINSGETCHNYKAFDDELEININLRKNTKTRIRN